MARRSPSSSTSAALLARDPYERDTRRRHRPAGAATVEPGRVRKLEQAERDAREARDAAWARVVKANDAVVKASRGSAADSSRPPGTARARSGEADKWQPRLQRITVSTSAVAIIAGRGRRGRRVQAADQEHQARTPRTSARPGSRPAPGTTWPPARRWCRRARPGRRSVVRDPVGRRRRGCCRSCGSGSESRRQRHPAGWVGRARSDGLWHL